MADGILGEGQHGVWASARGGVPSLGRLSPHISLSYSRVLDDTSTAQVVVGVTDPECCELLGQLRSWANEIVVYRDDDRVWEGVITNIEYGIEQVTISAQDVSAWLGVRFAHTAINTQSPEEATIDEETGEVVEPADPVVESQGPTDGALYLEQVVRDALLPDDPNILPYLLVSPSGEDVERITTVDQTVALEELQQVGEYAVDWTVLGRRIIIGERTVPDGYRIGPLLDRHFGEGLTLTDSGEAAVTRAVAGGDTNDVEASTDSAEDVEVGGVDPYYGLIERRFTPDGTNSDGELAAAAGQYLAEANPPPLVIANDGAIQILCDAPVEFAELIPGALVDVAIGELCRKLTTVMLLSAVNVEEDESGERVTVTLTPPGEVSNAQLGAV